MCYYSENLVFVGVTNPRHVTKRDLFVFRKPENLHYIVSNRNMHTMY